MPKQFNLAVVVEDWEEEFKTETLGCRHFSSILLSHVPASLCMHISITTSPTNPRGESF